MASEEEDSLDWLPDGWITGLQIMTNGKIDRYYTSPISGSTFRSQEEVMRHLTFENDGRFSSAALGYNGELSDHNPPPSHIKAQEDSPLWLPHGWIMEIKTRATGTRYKCYVEPSSGHRFYSKPEVFRYLQTGKTDTDEMIVNENPSDHILAQIECSPAGLPPGWIRELRYRRNSSGLRKDPGMPQSLSSVLEKARLCGSLSDMYYKDPVSGYVFRTKKDASRFVETGELGKYAIIHAAGKSIIDKYNIDGSPEDDMTSCQLFASPLLNSLNPTIEIAKNDAGLPVECLLLQNIEHGKPDGNGIEDSGRSFVAMLNDSNNTVDSNAQIYQAYQPEPNSKTPSEHDYKMIRPKSKSDVIFSNSGSSKMSYLLDKNLLGENNSKLNEGKSPEPMGGIDSSDIPPEKSSDDENGADMLTCHLRSRHDSEKGVSKSVEPKNIKDTTTEMLTRRTTRSHNCDSSNTSSTKSKTRITHLGSSIEKNTRRETRSTCHGSSSVKTTTRETRSSHQGSSDENTAKCETRSSHPGSSSEVTARRQTRNSHLDSSMEKTTKRPRRGRRGSLSRGTTTRRVAPSEASTRNNTESTHHGSSTRPETRSRRGRGSQRNSIISVKRVSKRLAGHGPDLTPDVDLTYRSLKKVIRRTPVAGSENVDGSSSIMNVDNVKGEGIPAAEAAIELPVECPLEISSPFGDAWPDPCIEFAFKTLTGDIPNFEDSAVVQYFKQQLTSTVSNPTTTSSPSQRDFVKIEFDGDHESMHQHELEQVKINQEFCTASKDEIIPAPQSFDGETKHE